MNEPVKGVGVYSIKRQFVLTGNFLMASVFRSWSTFVKASQWQRRKRVWRRREQRYAWEWRRQERCCTLSVGEEDSWEEGRELGREGGGGERWPQHKSYYCLQCHQTSTSLYKYHT